ncbi:MAG: PQQ-binding-like beta-propeller repeat protein [Verrucomicrobiia bacterium]
MSPAKKSATSQLIWRCSGADSSRRGIFPQRLKLKPKPIYTLPTAGAVQASVVFDDQSVCYVADMSGLVQAFVKDRPVWQSKLNGSLVASPIICGKQGYLFAATVAGSVYAIDPKSGQTLYKKNIPTESDPRILSDLLYVEKLNVVVLNSWGGKFYALSADTLEEKLYWDAGITPYAGASADSDGNIYLSRALQGRGIEFVKISSESKETVLSHEPEGRRGARRTIVSAAPVIDDSKKQVYFLANRDVGSHLCAFSTETGALLWRLGLPNQVQATPTLRPDGVLIVSDLRGLVLGIRTDGSLLFQYNTNSEYLIGGGVCEQGGTFFTGDPLGYVHQISERGSGKVFFESQRAILARPSFSPEGNLYIPSTDKNVYVFESQKI